MTTPLVVVHGTWGVTHGAFWAATSEFQNRARQRGLDPPRESFWWSGDLCLTDPMQWKIAGSALAWYCRALHLEAPAAITHSHGIQVLAYAASYGQRFSSVVDIEGPVRRDLFDVYAAAHKNLGGWLHTWNGGDAIILAGEFPVAGEATALMPPPASNMEIPAHYGHSGLFDDLDAWDTVGLWRRLGGGA